MFAINRALKGLQRSSLKLRNKNKPRASSLFLSPLISFIRSFFKLPSFRLWFIMQQDQQFTSEAFSQYWKKLDLRWYESTSWYWLSQQYALLKWKSLICYRDKAQHAFTSETFRLPQANTYISASSTTDNSILEKLIKAIISPVGSGGNVWGVDLWLGGTWTVFQTVWPAWDWRTKDAQRSSCLSG